MPFSFLLLSEKVSREMSLDNGATPLIEGMQPEEAFL